MKQIIPTRKGLHVWRWMAGILLLIIVAMGMAIWQRLGPNPLDPMYEGHRLSHWLHGHPREYVPVVQALGTNAVPYLLAELQVTDPAWLRWAEERFRRLEMGPSWDTARVHHYHARLALQILDTNALPVLLGVVFDRPMQMADGDLGYEAAFTLTWLASPAAKDAIQQRLSDRKAKSTTGNRPVKSTVAMLSPPCESCCLTSGTEPISGTALHGCCI